jgi:uncharacterized membrane protein YbaN (DUF454 family)
MYNWRNVLSDFAAISGVLAGFTITLIVFILGWQVADTPILLGITWGHIGVLLNGTASAFFVTAAEFFLGSKQLDMWALPSKYEDQLQRDWKDWKERKEKSLLMCRLYEKRGRRCYNASLFLMFLGIGCVIAPYNAAIAVVVVGSGILLQVYQYCTAPPKPTEVRCPKCGRELGLVAAGYYCSKCDVLLDEQTLMEITTS